MSILIHLLLTILILYCVVAYVATSYATFFAGDAELKKQHFFLKLFFVLFSPLIMLDVVLEKITGKSLL